MQILSHYTYTPLTSLAPDKTQNNIQANVTYTALLTAQRQNLHHLLTVQPPRSTRSGTLVTLSRRPTAKLKISDRFFYHKAPAIRNSLHAHLRQSRLSFSFQHSLYTCTLPSSVPGSAYDSAIETVVYPVDSPQCSSCPNPCQP